MGHQVGLLDHDARDSGIAQLPEVLLGELFGSGDDGLLRLLVGDGLGQTLAPDCLRVLDGVLRVDDKATEALRLNGGDGTVNGGGDRLTLRLPRLEQLDDTQEPANRGLEYLQHVLDGLGALALAAGRFQTDETSVDVLMEALQRFLLLALDLRDPSEVHGGDATSVERPHRELRARLTDGLGPR